MCKFKTCQICEKTLPVTQFFKFRNGVRTTSCRDCSIVVNHTGQLHRSEILSFDFKLCNRFLRTHTIKPERWEMTLC